MISVRARWMTGLVLVQGCALQAPARPAAIPASVLDELSAIVAAALHEQQAPGASLVVMKGDEIVLARGYGLETVERTDAVAPSTVFLLNSMSKQFTAALILKLAEEGRLTLDDPVARYLPDFTHLPPGLKIRHLLTHTTGMREIVAQPELNAVLEKLGTSNEEFLALARHSPSDFAPGSRWSYANTNYLMLTLIAERVTGQPLEDALRAGRLNGSTQQSLESLSWRIEAEALSRSRVQFDGDDIKILLRQGSHRNALWEILSQQSIGILIGATLPRTVWISEVHVEPCVGCHRVMARELHATIPGERAAQLLRQSTHLARETGGDRVHITSGELDEHRESRGAFDDRRELRPVATQQ